MGVVFDQINKPKSVDENNQINQKDYPKFSGLSIETKYLGTSLDVHMHFCGKGMWMKE